ncbi:hypothetical protein CC79DRAFT_2969 [Sarocladium strictum]
MRVINGCGGSLVALTSRDEAYVKPSASRDKVHKHTPNPLLPSRAGGCPGCVKPPTPPSLGGPHGAAYSRRACLSCFRPVFIDRAHRSSMVTRAGPIYKCMLWYRGRPLQSYLGIPSRRSRKQDGKRTDWTKRF